MLHFILLPIVLAAAAASDPSTAGTEVFRCTFDPTWDPHFDGWPKGWTRRVGEGFPSYVTIKMDKGPAPDDPHCLRISLDGGGGAAFSPPVEISPLSEYVLEARLRTEGLEQDRTWISLTWLDGARRRLQTCESLKVQQTQGWQSIRLGPLACESQSARYAVIGLHLEPQTGEDLHGAALFTDVRLGRLPRMSLSSSNPHHFFTDPESVEVTCTVSGLGEQLPQITFELEDALGRSLAQSQQPLHLDDVPAAGLEGGPSPQAQPRTGKAAWKPPLAGPGFYRVRATAGEEKRGHSTFSRVGQVGVVSAGKVECPLFQGPETQRLSLVVVAPAQATPGGEFGWSLPRGDQPLPLPALARLLEQAGVSWVKYPLWCENADNPAAIEPLLALSERLESQGITMVGLLSEPPRSLRDRFAPGSTPSAAEIFRLEPKVWYPTIEPVLARLATEVRWWQLGTDTDTSFAGEPDLPGRIAKVKSELGRVCQDVNVGFGWDWRTALPHAEGNACPWRFLSLSADPPLSAAELSEQLAVSRRAGVARWVVLTPLSRQSHSAAERATDLVQQMLAAKIGGAEVIFCAEPFSSDHGLMNDDGTPGELLLPWRTVALQLGGAKYLGSIDLPGGSSNHVFTRDGEAVMVVWSMKPAEEVLYLGEQVRQLDLWGRSVAPAERKREQVVEVGTQPALVTGLSEPIARWRIACRFAEEKLPCVLGLPHGDSLIVSNTFAHEVAGVATVVTPQGWKVSPREIRFHLAAGEELRQKLEITFPFTAESGPQPVRVDFQLDGESPERFSVYRQIAVGLGDVRVELSSRLNDKGQLEVVQEFVNDSDQPVSFRCELSAPDRRLMTQIIQLGRGRETHTYILPDGQSLIGKPLGLRAAEVNGPRVLNYRFVGTK